MPFFLWVPKLHVQAITLWFIVLWTGPTLPDSLRRHETIHYRQYNETWVLGFLFIYLWDFLRAFGRLPFWEAYTRIRFEQEAYAHQEDPAYLEARSWWAWLDYEV